jgi:hypothetical protein
MRHLRYAAKSFAALCLVLLAGSCNPSAPDGAQPKGAPTDAFGLPVRYAPRPSIAHEGMADSLTKASPRLTDIGNLLAGLPVDASSSVAGVMKSPAWQNHKETFGRLWNEVDTMQLRKIKAWREKEVDPLACSNKSLFYPFSGPDFLYANTMFPKANLYVMGGLEPVGEVPDLSAFTEEQLASSFRGLQVSLNDILIWSFFRTIDMNVDLKQNQLKGVTPVIMVFMAYTGHEILAVNKVALDKRAEIVPNPNGGAQTLMENEDGILIPGLHMVFRKKGEEQVKQLYYFSVNLSDYVANNLPEYKAFVQKMRYPAGYLKGASYLMHNDYFSVVRNLMLEECTCVLEDDSGIPVRFFMNEKWDTKFYGHYTTPIGLFANRFQPDLRQIYVDGKSVYPIEFGIGYRFKKGESNMMLAVDKAYEAKVKGAPAPVTKEVEKADMAPVKEAPATKAAPADTHTTTDTRSLPPGVKTGASK